MIEILNFKLFKMFTCYVFKLLGKIKKLGFDIFCNMAPSFGKTAPDFAYDVG
jgi:hypothetical protein